MHTIKLARTELEVSRLGFGTASLHHLYRLSQRLSILEEAFEAGFTHFDTAPMYGEGQAERTLGRFLAAAKVRQNITLATKIGFPARPVMQAFPLTMLADKTYRAALSRAGIARTDSRRRCLSESSCEKSLTQSIGALGTDYIDLLMVHEPQQNEATQIEALADWFDRQKSVGRVRYIGLAGSVKKCIGLSKQLPGLFDVLQVEDSIEFDEAAAIASGGWPLQITYGYLRRSFEQTIFEGERDPLDAVRAALEKNDRGMVLVSTRKKIRVEEFAALVEEADNR